MREGNRTGNLATAVKGEETEPTRPAPGERTNLYGSEGGGTWQGRVADDSSALWVTPVLANTSAGNRQETFGRGLL